MKEENILESFKQYHNANWYDGDNTFDECTYAKSNGEDFTDLFVQDCFDHYEAGYHSGYEKAYKELKNGFGTILSILDRLKYSSGERCYDEVRAFVNKT